MANLMNIQYGSKAYQLPKSLITNEDFVKEIVSANVWNNKLRKSDKMNLLKFLPNFSNNDTHEKKETLKKLFLGKHINFENQIKTFVRLVKDGDFNPSIKIHKGLDLILAERNRKIALFKRRLNDLQKIINVKKSLSMKINQEEQECLQEFHEFLSRDEPLSDIINLRFDKIMQKITGDPDEAKKSQLYESYLKNNSLDFKSLTLCDVINRCQNENDVVNEEPPLISNGPMTRKRREMQNGFENSLSKYAKFNESSDSQSDSSEDCRSNDDNSDDSVTSDTDSVGSGTANEAMISENHKRVRLNRHERREFRCPQDDFSDYFSLLQCLFVGAHQQKLTTHQIEDRIRHWHIVNKRNIGDNFNRWAQLSLDWVCLAVPALTYLSVVDMSPIVEHRKKSQLWRWKKEIDNQVMRKLFSEWHHHQTSNGAGTLPGTLRAIGMSGNSAVAECEQIPPPLFQTEWRVRPSTPDERMRFQNQERKRFMRPWRGFMYNIHGYNCVVAPIRGCLPGRDYSNVKARGHPLLVNERPPHVNIVEIVRDAVARLPNGEGSRADIVCLAMDSAFWSSTAPGNEKSISQCISSALDRLQGEGCDPSVKYNARLKLWFYRHRNKCLEELEQIHIQHSQDDIRRFRSTTASTSNGTIRPSSRPSMLYNHQIILSHNQSHAQPLQASQPPLSTQQVTSRYGQVQTYQQFSQAVNHARDLTMQSIYISRPPANVYHSIVNHTPNHQLLSSNSTRIVTPRPDLSQDYYPNQQHNFYY